MAIADDISIDVSGNIRRAVAKASMNNYTTIALHRFLGGLSDDASSAGDDYHDASRPIASDRTTDNYITIKPPYNVDADLMEHIYGGTVIQANGDERWDPITVLAPASTPIEVLQNEAAITPNFFQNGINADASNGISHQFCIKVRTAASDIDGRRLLVQTRNWTKQHSEFKLNGTSIGVNVAALSANADSNNATSESTVEGYTTIVNLTNGYKALDVNNDGTSEYYYSEWDRAAYTKNDMYERAKWLSGMPRTEDSCTDTGSDFPIGNGTTTGQAQSFANGVNATYPRRLKVDLKKVGSPTGTITAKVYAITGSFGTTSAPTSTALVTSATYDVSKLDTVYREVEFGFQTAYALTASTNYAVTLEYSGGGVSDYVHVRGLATTGTHAGNRASYAAAVWTATATDDLRFNIETCGQLYGLPGNIFRGVTHQLALTTPRSGTFASYERVTWTGGAGQMLAIDSATAGTAMWIQVLSGVAPTTGLLITGTSTATATTTGTAVERETPQKGALPFIGQSTGSALFGGYGIGIQTADLTAADRLTHLGSVQMTPPNNVLSTFDGLVSGEDYLVIGPLAYFLQYDGESGGAWTDGETLTFTSPAGTAKLLQVLDNGTTGYMWIRMLTGSVPIDNSTITGGTSTRTANVNQAPQPELDHENLTLNGTLSGAAVTSVVVSEAIPSWTPATGNLRIRRDSGRTTVHPYSAVVTGTKTFTITSHNFSTDNATTGNGVCVTPVDQLASGTSHTFTGVYTSDVSLFYRRRDGGGTPTKPQEQAFTLSSTGSSVTAIRQSDA